MLTKLSKFFKIISQRKKMKKWSILIKRYLNYIEPIEHSKKMWVVGTQKTNFIKTSI